MTARDGSRPVIRGSRRKLLIINYLIMNQEYGHCIIGIGNFLVSSEVVTEFFACDYEACRGACCVAGESGAPLTMDEAREIGRNYGAVEPLMEEAGREAVARKGFFEVDRDGESVTPLVGRGSGDGPAAGVRPGFGDGPRPWSADDRECAYARFEGGGRCFCAIERAWMAGRCGFRKPASCSLYPIRVSDLANGLRAVNFHRWDICAAAFEKGRRENVRVFEFLEGPIRRYFGSEFYTALRQCAEHLL